ncbi:hypothetical protein [Bacillus sp. 204(2023)]|uniref:hypothetical protein n=1 Tax=Bacillus sp. 204(2023) TaxID=3096766 RepID=UPI00300A1267
MSYKWIQTYIHYELTRNGVGTEIDKTSEKRSQRLKPAKVTDEGGGWLGVCQAEFRRAGLLFCICTGHSGYLEK